MAKIIADMDLFISEIKGLILQKKWTELRESLTELPAPDIATLLLNLGKAACALVFRLLPRSLSTEVFSCLSLGFTMAAGRWALGLFRGGFEIGLVVGLAMICIVVVANILGAALPFLLTKLRLDPAVASSPLIASITDAAGLLIYFSIAVRIIGRI